MNNPDLPAASERELIAPVGRRVQRLVRLLWAYLRCEVYLLRAMWSGECMLTGYGTDGRIALIASTTGNIFDNTLTIKRIFYREQQPNDRTQPPRAGE